MDTKTIRMTALLGTVALLSACAPIAITAGGVGGSAAVQHTLGGIFYDSATATEIILQTERQLGGKA